VLEGTGRWLFQLRLQGASALDDFEGRRPQLPEGHALEVLDLIDHPCARELLFESAGDPDTSAGMAGNGIGLFADQLELPGPQPRTVDAGRLSPLRMPVPRGISCRRIIEHPQQVIAPLLLRIHAPENGHVVDPFKGYGRRGTVSTRAPRSRHQQQDWQQGPK